ncbi:MAG: 50S ribosomal protein L6 [Verrucomicrobia bacterium]|nr:50S ribosomal protein L6 [Verrucomicrobiota bacterium]
MSRIGEKPISIPSGVKVEINESKVSINGASGTLVWTVPPLVKAKIEGEEILVERENDTKPAKSLHGTSRSVIANMIEGVHKGFAKELEIQGVGFRANLQGQTLVMSLGFSHPIEFQVPEGIQVKVEDNGTRLVITGADKQLVGQVSARLRAFSPAEPYKGKGVRYKGEHVRRKAGKTVA